jgi:hypothetical protein
MKPIVAVPTPVEVITQPDRMMVLPGSGRAVSAAETPFLDSILNDPAVLAGLTKMSCWRERPTLALCMRRCWPQQPWHRSLWSQMICNYSSPMTSRR